MRQLSVNDYPFMEPPYPLTHVSNRLGEQICIAPDHYMACQIALALNKAFAPAFSTVFQRTAYHTGGDQCPIP